MAQTINVNTTPGQFMPTLYYSQGDIGRVYEIVLASSDGWTIPSGATVEMVATKPSGLGFTVAGTLSGNVASFTTTETMTNEWGRYPAEIRIKSGTDVIGTANFYLNGERNPHPDGTTDGDAESLIPELTLLVERVEAAAASVLDMEVIAETLPAGSDATYSYDEETNTATFGIPRGADGEVSFKSLADATAVQTLSNNTPYLFRQTPKAGHSEFDTLVGGSVAFNQQLYDGDFASSNGWTTLPGGSRTISNNECVIEITANFGGIQTDAGYVSATNRPTLISGHKYFMSANIKASNSRTNSVAFGLSNVSSGNAVRKTVSVGTSYASYAFIGTPSATTAQSDVRFMIFDTAGGSSNTTLYVKNVMSIDLTQLFGSTVADAIYAMEQATAGSGVAYFRSLFGASYYPYNAGELLSVGGVSAHNMTEKNLLSSEMELGTINGSGNNTSDNSAMRSISAIPIFPNTAYTYSQESNSGEIWANYYSDGVFVSRVKVGTTASVATFTTPANVNQLRMRCNLASSGVLIGKNQLEFGSTATAYEPYEIHSYPLDNSLTLRGIPKWNNGLYYDGDVYEADGTVTRKYGIVDFGTLNWNYVSNKYFQSATISSDIKGADQTQPANFLAQGYRTIAWNDSTGVSMDIAVNENGLISCQNASYTSASAFKTAMSGVYAVYELKTITTETADPYQKAQICDPSGTEEYVSTSIVPVGHNTDYPMTITDIAPTSNGTYTLKCTVSGGVKTYEWVSA